MTGRIETIRRIAGRGLAIAMIAIGGQWIANSAGAATITVTHLVDDTSLSNGTCTLREAIQAANTNVAIDACPAGSSAAQDQVVVKAGVHRVDLTAPSDDTGNTGDLDVVGPVWIRGASSRHTIVQGTTTGALHRLLEIHDVVGDVRIEGLALRGGNATDGDRRGGVVRNRESGQNAAELVDVEISGGHADWGGGIHNEGLLTLRRSRVVDNRASETTPLFGGLGGGISSDGGSSLLILEDTEIARNQATDDGGGIWAHDGGFAIVRSKVSDNVAGGDGGGLYVVSMNYEIGYVEFARNRAFNGGGIYARTPGEILRSLFVANVGSAQGGGLTDVGGAIVRFSTFTQNESAKGPAIYASTNQTLLDSDTIADNVGAGLFNQQGIFLENTLLARNGVASCGGNPPNFGAFNLEDANTCGLTSTPVAPNLTNTNPLLGALADNGGPTRTMALLPGSPAIDFVSSEIRTNCQNMLDQRAYPRGRPRTKNAANQDVYHCDAGAFERVAAFVVDSFVDLPDASPNDDRCITTDGVCTLRAAAQQANAIPGLNEIVLSAGTYALTRAGTGEEVALTGDIDLRPPVLVRGAGVLQTRIDGSLLDRVFDVGDLPLEISPAPTTSYFRDLEIRNGYAGTQNGGGIALSSPIRLDRVRLVSNFGFRGAAISSSKSGSFFGSTRTLVEIVDSTIETNGGGGALFLADAVLLRSSLVNNIAEPGFNGGGGEFARVLIEDSTVSGNESTATGAFFADSALIESSAIYGNGAQPGFDPGGIFVLSLSAIRNSIVANNRAGNVLSNCSGNPNAIASLGFNVTDGSGSDCALAAPLDQVSVDPRLDTLEDNGGPTLTRLLLAGSPAIDRGDPATCPRFDQRGTWRPLDGDGNGSAVCDVGPVEVPEPEGIVALGAGLLPLALGARGERRRIARLSSSPRAARSSVA